MGKKLIIYVQFFLYYFKKWIWGKKNSQFFIKKKLIACANIYKKIDSYFLWENKITKSKEVVLIGKTIKKNQNKLVKEVKKIHSYKVPCIIFSNISSGNKKFLNWIKLSVK